MHMPARILFVERNLTSADLLAPSLVRKGYKVFLAHTRRQALNHSRSVYPDILIVDVASFGAAGYALLDAVQPELDGVPVILLLEEGHAVAGEQAEAFMLPPFTSRKLLHRVKTVAEALPSREIRAGALALDPVSRTLSMGQATCHLRPKEAQLLALFLRNPGRVLGRREIMRRVWETDYIGDTRTLSVHVRWLRQKIEDDPDKPRLLRTVRGVGYRFEPVGPPPQEKERSANH
jgi:DNA-binding response OmpR family regulator